MTSKCREYNTYTATDSNEVWALCLGYCHAPILDICIIINTHPSIPSIPYGSLSMIISIFMDTSFCISAVYITFLVPDSKEYTKWYKKSEFIFIYAWSIPILSSCFCLGFRLAVVGTADCTARRESNYKAASEQAESLIIIRDGTDTHHKVGLPSITIYIYIFQNNIH